MKITKVVPRGFCSGVVDAWMAIEKTIKEKPYKKYYMIGWFVHNEFMVEKMKSMGIIILDDTNKSRYEIIDQLKFDKDATLIFSSHGTDYKAIELAKNKGFEIIDATCIYVKKIHQIIKSKIKENKFIIFYGSKNHPESLSVKAIDNNQIEICSSLEQLKKLVSEKKDSQIFFTNQTTISKNDYLDAYEFLKNQTKLDIEIENDICPATNERQDAIDQLVGVDLLIVVGDNRSNNSKKLKEKGLANNIETILISDASKIDDNIFKSKKNVAITAGASTPTWIIKEVIDYVTKRHA